MEETRRLLTGETLPNESELTIGGLVSILRRRRRVILTVTLFCLLAGILVCVFMTRQYQADGTVQVDKSSPDGLGLGTLTNDQGGQADALGDNMTIQTQAEILQSDTLALNVIKRLNLEQNRDFKPHFNPISWVLGMISPAGEKDAPGASLDNAPARRTRLLRIFNKRLKVKPVTGTRLIEISFTNSDPKTAAAVVNQLTQALLQYTYETRNAATAQASEWLASQLADVRRQAEASEARVTNLQRQTGVYNTGSTDATGHDQTYSATIDRLQQATAALATATSNRILRGGIVKAVKSGDPELISGLAGSTLTGNSSGTNNAFNLLQQLRTQQATLSTQMALDRSRYGSANPKLQDDQATMASLNKAINQEIQRIGDRAESDYRSAQTVEDQLRQEFEKQRAAAAELNNKAIDYTIARQEATDDRQLYDALFQKLKTAGVMQGLHTANITVVDPGRTPSKPVKPNVPIYLAASIFGGAFLGMCLGLFQEATDKRIQSLDVIEDSLQTPVIAVLPMAPNAEQRGLSSYLGTGRLASRAGMRGDLPIAALDGPRSAFAEAMRALRTELQLFVASKPPRILLVTSAAEQEGKSTVSTNLAVVLAQGTGRVLLVDADLRQPGISRRFGCFGSGYEGLSTLLEEDARTEDVVQQTKIPRLSLLPAGALPPSPSDLLASPRMQQLLTEWSQTYDYVVIDTPPLLAVTDAAILSRVSDATLLVARHGLTTRNSLKRAYRSLSERAEAQVHVVVNGVSRSSPMYGEYHGYVGTKYYKEA